jgi:murein DD-endopeptidase MepM/ murein hydrolase activator NlpD
MSRKSGRVKRVLSRWFKERQIYHRSDGVVHFIQMSTKTQIVLVTMIGAFLAWVAYSSVNVVFQAQINVAREKQFRNMETTYTQQINKQMRAFDDVASLNVIMQREYDATLADISSRHQTLRTMVERKAATDQQIEALAKGLAQAGAPNGAKPLNGNRVMVDVLPAEATPRQSRLSVLRREAIEASRTDRPDIPATSPAAAAIQKMEAAAADLYVEQMLLLAALEERSKQTLDELRLVFAATGVEPDDIIPPVKISNTVLAQGGPFIDASSSNDGDSAFFRHANRVGLLVDELSTFEDAALRVPLSSPLMVTRKQTSGFGVRKDPINGRLASHLGIDFQAAWASPVTATAAGTVKYAGMRSGWGRMVEIDHGNGFSTRYAHLSRITVSVGQKVKLHDKVGELGSTGRSTGPHVHYEVLYKGKQRNPRRFIEAGRYVFES